jgi:hypothetical protein
MRMQLVTVSYSRANHCIKYISVYEIRKPGFYLTTQMLSLITYNSLLLDYTYDDYVVVSTKIHFSILIISTVAGWSTR